MNERIDHDKQDEQEYSAFEYACNLWPMSFTAHKAASFWVESTGRDTEHLLRKLYEDGPEATPSMIQDQKDWIVEYVIDAESVQLAEQLYPKYKTIRDDLLMVEAVDGKYSREQLNALAKERAEKPLFLTRVHRDEDYLDPRERTSLNIIINALLYKLNIDPSSRDTTRMISRWVDEADEQLDLKTIRKCLKEVTLRRAEKGE